MSQLRKKSRFKLASSCPGLSRASTSSETAVGKVVDGRAFAAPKGLRPRRRVKPGHDEQSGSQHLSDPVVRIVGAAVLDVDQLLAQAHGDRAGGAAGNEEVAAAGADLPDRRDDGGRAAGKRLFQLAAGGVRA